MNPTRFRIHHQSNGLWDLSEKNGFWSFFPTIAPLALLIAAPLTGAQVALDFESASRWNNTTTRNFDPPSNQTLISDDIYDNGNIYETQVNNNGGQPVIDSSTSRNGTRSLFFDMTTQGIAGGANRRSELWIEGSRNPRDPNDVVTDTQRVPFGEERWYGMSFKLGDNYRQNSNWIISQWWQTSNTNTTPAFPPLSLFVQSSDSDGNGSTTGSSDQLYLAMEAFNNQVYVNGRPSNQPVQLNIGGSSRPGTAVNIPGRNQVGTPIDRDAWYDVLVHYRFSSVYTTSSGFWQTRPDAFVQYYVSPQGAGTYQLAGEAKNFVMGYANDGTTQNTSANRNNNNFGVALKAGVYSTPGGNDQSNNRMWLDDIRSGFTVGDVDPKQHTGAETKGGSLGLGDGWTLRDIGRDGNSSDRPAGASNDKAGGFDVTGEGGGLAGTADEFAFVYRSLSDVEGSLITRVDRQTDTHPYAQAGLIIRGNAASSTDRFAGVFLTPDNGVHFRVRTAAGATALQLASSPASISAENGPVWLRLTQTGSNTYRAYYSTVSASSGWTAVGGETNVNISGTNYGGLAVGSSAERVRGEAGFSETMVTGFGTGPTNSGRLQLEGFRGDLGPVGSAAWERTSNSSQVRVDNNRAGVYGGKNFWNVTHSDFDRYGQTLTRVFTVAGGSYKLSGRYDEQSNNSGTDDSYWLRVDGGNWQLVTGFRSWSGATVYENDNFTFNLDPGFHVVEIAQREDGARIDWIQFNRVGG